MIEPSGQPDQTAGEPISPTLTAPPDINIGTVPTISSLMATTQPDTPLTGEIPQVVSAPPVSIPENLAVGLPNNPQNILSQDTNTAITRKFQHILVPIIVLFSIVIVISSIAYAYLNKIGPFGSSIYTEANFSSSILGKISEINSASYTFSAALDVVPREPDATPFIFTAGNDEELKQKYASDVARWENIRQILQKLQNDLMLGKNLANTLTDRFSSEGKNLYGDTGFSDISLIDPLTEKEYEYAPTEDKKDFKLTVIFETNELMEAIKNAQISPFGNSSPNSTLIEDKKVTFSKESNIFIQVNPELPKPFLVEISDSMSMIPPDIKGKIAITASSEFKPQSMADWSFNFDSEGSFSDVTYKANTDILKKGNNYYFKINNLPVFFLFEKMAPIKGKWIVLPSPTTITPTTDTPTTPKEISGTRNFQDMVKNGEESYKKNRDTIIKVIKKVALVADREKLLTFKSVPRSETIDGKKFTRYELSIKKDTLQAFYTGLIAEIQNDPELMTEINTSNGVTTDEQKEALRLKEETTKKEVADYLKSEEFTQIFDYIEKNNSFIIWTDADGFPVIIQNTMRIVPSDTAEKLKDKQITLIYTLAISNINVPIVLTAPTDAVPWDTISKELNPYQDKIEENTIMAGLASINTIAHSVAAIDGSYGKKGFGVGPCKPTVDTLFANTYIIEELNRLTNNDMSVATCAARGREGKVASWAISVPLQNEPGFSYCIDTTTSKKIAGNLKGLTCK